MVVTSCHIDDNRNMIAIMLIELAPVLDGLPGQEMRFAAGEAVFHLGDEICLVHLVRVGVIHLVRHQVDGAVLVLQRAGAGSILGEASVYSDHYHCDAYADMESVTWSIPREALRQCLIENSGLTETWAKYLTHEVQRARLQAEILSLKTVKARLNAWLNWNGSLPAKGHWAAIAAEIAVTPEALYREIGRQRESGHL